VFRGAALLDSEVVLLMLVSMAAAATPDARGTLRLTLMDEASGLPTPERVEVLDAKSIGYMAEDALPIDGECMDRDIPPITLWSVLLL